MRLQRNHLSASASTFRTRRRLFGSRKLPKYPTFLFLMPSFITRILAARTYHVQFWPSSGEVLSFPSRQIRKCESWQPAVPQGYISYPSAVGTGDSKMISHGTERTRSLGFVLDASFQQPGRTSLFPLNARPHRPPESGRAKAKLFPVQPRVPLQCHLPGVGV